MWLTLFSLCAWECCQFLTTNQGLTGVSCRVIWTLTSINKFRNRPVAMTKTYWHFVTSFQKWWYLIYTYQTSFSFAWAWPSILGYRRPTGTQECTLYNPNLLFDMHGCLVWSLDHSFKNGVRTAVTVKLHCYTLMIETFLKSRIQNLSGHESLCFQQGSTIAHAKNYCGCTLQFVSSVADLLLWWCDTAWTFTQCNCSRPFIFSVPCLPLLSSLGIGKQWRIF